MTLVEFLNLGETHQLSPEQAQALNQNLGSVDINDIPPQHRARVLDYLVVAINMGSVAPNVLASLDKLRQSLESD